MQENNVCSKTVAQNLCVGCGICAGICPHSNLIIQENAEGGYNPVSLGHCLSSCSECLHVCPFQDHDFNEDSLGKTLYGETTGIRHRTETGYFLNTYVGHVADSAHRWRGASGGMATWFLKKLLLNDIVDHVICVTPQQDPHKLFAFEILSDPDDILRSAKSAYYPVELSSVLQSVSKRPGRYALIGLPCFIKSVRLAALRNAKLRERIVVYAGLVCGQLKTKGFTEGLIRKMNLDPGKIRHFCFRHKIHERPASNFSVTASDDRATTAVQWSDFCSLAWMSGMFKLKSCNFCDDVFSELADICFMDAWLPEYTEESAGTSLVITRSAIAEQIIREAGIKNGKCDLQEIPVRKVIESQSFVVITKREMLQHRLWVESKKGRIIPQKRVTPKKPHPLDWLHILNAEAIRSRSFMALSKQRASGDVGLAVFLKQMRKDLYFRKWLYRFNRENFKAGIKRRIDNIRKRIRSLLNP